MSRATVVGRVDPPIAASWEEALALPATYQRMLLDFQAFAAGALGVPVSRLRLHQKWGAGDMEKARRAPGRWHRDSYRAAAHVTCVLGEPPTEFLLGTFPDHELERKENIFRDLEDRLERWSPAPGEVVLVDPVTLHRRPILVSERRLFLLAEAAGSMIP